MLEREIERRFGAMLKKRGCLYYKFVSPGNPGVPDRIVIFPDGRLFFVELKTDRGALSQQQQARIKELRTHGQSAMVLRGLSECMEFVDRYQRDIPGKDGIEGGDLFGV